MFGGITVWDNHSSEKLISKKHISLKKIFMFWQLTLSYALLMIVPFVMGIVIISFTHNNLLNQSKNMNIFQLENTMRTIESSLSLIDDLSSTLSSDTKLIQFLNTSQPDKGKLTYSLFKTKNSLLPLKDSNKLIEGYFIYSLVNNTVVSPDQGFANLEIYYDKYLRYSDLNYEEFKRLLSEKYNKELLSPKPFLYGYSTSDCYTILYINTLYNTIGKAVGQIVIRINAEKVKDLMSPAISASSGSMYIFEKDGTILLSYPEADKPLDIFQYDFSKVSDSFEWEVNNTRMFVSYHVSDKTGWIYLITVPLNDLLNRTKNIMNTIILNLIIFYGIIIVISYFSIKYNRHPLVNMVKILPTKMVSPEKVMKSGISHISTVVTEIVSDIEHLEERVKEQKNLLQNIILFGLESGEIKNEAVLNQLASNLNISFDGKYLRGAYILIRDSEKSHGFNMPPTYNQEIQDFLSSDSRHFPIVSSKETNLFAMLYQQSLKEDKQVYLSIFRNIYHTLSNKFGLESVIYLGHPCEDVMNVHESFEAAKRLINLNVDTSSNHKFLMECQTSDNGNDYYVYSIRDEQKLMNLILTYDEKGIHCLLIDIFRKNFIERSLTNFMRRILFARILGTILSFTELVSLAPELKNSLADIEPRLFFELIEKQCIQICNSLREKNEENNKRTLEQILEYINENICNYELSLNMIAMKFNMSESYLSMCIKEYTGQNFTAYVEELRMKKANSLLDMGKHTIAEIAEKVGYSNPHSFRRAYKRLYGFSPSEYKKWKCKSMHGSTSIS